MDAINQIISTGVKILKKHLDVCVDKKFAQEYKNSRPNRRKLALQTIISSLEVDKHASNIPKKALA